MTDRTESTLQAVQKAVVHLILEGGVPAVTLSAVCRQAGISKGGLMHHFPTKEAMVRAFVRRSCDKCLAETHQVLSGIEAGRGRKTLVFVDRILSNPAMCHPEESRDLSAVMIAMMQGSADEEARRWYDTIYRELRGDEVPKSAIDLVIAAIDGLWLQSMVLPSDVVQARAEQLRKQLKRTIKASVRQAPQSV